MATEGFASRLESVTVHAKETLADLGCPWALVGGLAVSVARVSEFLALKILARDDERRRPQDTIDIRALLQEATASDLEVTKTALALIVERGFHRKRDLLQDFEDLTKRFLS